VPIKLQRGSPQQESNEVTQIKKGKRRETRHLDSIFKIPLIHSVFLGGEEERRVKDEKLI